MKMTATGGALAVGAPAIVAGGGEAALLTRAGVQGTVQAGRTVISEVAKYGVKGAVLGNPVASTVVATEATAATAAVVFGADTPVSAAEAAAARRVKNAAVRMVESSSSAGVRGVPQTTGALSAGSVGAARVPGSHVEQELLALPAPPKPAGLLEYKPGNKADFYVNSNGQAIPSTGYRAVGGPAVDKAKAGNIQSSGDTYITFDDITGMSPSEAKSLLQLPHAPSHVAKFDTLPLVDDLQIPAYKWNTWRSDSFVIPEPRTKAFPVLRRSV